MSISTALTCKGPILLEAAQARKKRVPQFEGFTVFNLHTQGKASHENQLHATDGEG